MDKTEQKQRVEGTKKMIIERLNSATLQLEFLGEVVKTSSSPPGLGDLVLSIGSHLFDTMEMVKGSWGMDGESAAPEALTASP